MEYVAWIGEQRLISCCQIHSVLAHDCLSGIESFRWNDSTHLMKAYNTDHWKQETAAFTQLDVLFRLIEDMSVLREHTLLHTVHDIDLHDDWSHFGDWCYLDEADISNEAAKYWVEDMVLTGRWKTVEDQLFKIRWS